MPLFANLGDFYRQYEMPLARVMHSVEQRGVLMDAVGLAELSTYIGAELIKACTNIARTTNTAVGWNKPSAAALGASAVNLQSPKQVIEFLKSLGLKVPKSRKSGKETSGEDALNTLFAESGNPALKEILRVRELGKIKGTYVNASLLNNVLYCSYVVPGTVGGRRSSRVNFLGYGTNHQNQPKHSDLGRRFRRCIVARPGKIFVSCDQVQAEDWIVNGIIADVAGYSKGLEELKAGVDRHTKLASFIFAKPESECGKDANHNDTPFRFMGKKTRHAFNYKMQGRRMSAELAKEGYSVDRQTCEAMLQRVRMYDPAVEDVFQRYVEAELTTKRMLRTPIGRERYFLNLRSYGDNSKTFRNAYSYIPQSTVGDNTGLAILHCERARPELVVMDVHDAVVLEVDDSVDSILSTIHLLTKSFDRTLEFPVSGLKINIPVEHEIGYSLGAMRKCGNLNADGLKAILAGLKTPPSPPNSIIFGQRQPLSQQP